MSDVLTLVLVTLFLIVIVASAASTRYMARIYNRSQEPRSWFFRMMLNSARLKVVCGGYLGYEAATLLLNPILTRLFDLVMPRVPPEINTPVLVIIATILVSPPIYYANTIREIRKRGVYDPETVLSQRTVDSPAEAAKHLEDQS